ncbi:hypothetical protein PVL29_008479 [Vitis rotundifolia]|uniref:Uncharacterized protein n=1 Tax=Vitis rotundifolia TaxID=103349 RepID=A0AA39DU74_VITRO|nr:hypothetical protein PVL29_008479 [Vitis rotundifolia]
MTLLPYMPSFQLPSYATLRQKGLGTCDDDPLYEDFSLTPVALIQFLLQLSILVLVCRKHLPELNGMKPVAAGGEYCGCALAYLFQSPGILNNHPDIVMNIPSVHDRGLVSSRKN